jgi:hypothetical protein
LGYPVALASTMIAFAGARSGSAPRFSMNRDRGVQRPGEQLPQQRQIVQMQAMRRPPA